LIEAHLPRRRQPHPTRSPSHAGAGGARSRAISDRMSWNICRNRTETAAGLREQWVYEFASGNWYLYFDNGKLVAKQM
jgi:hypothetical protein